MSKPSRPAPQRPPFNLQVFLSAVETAAVRIAATVERTALRIMAMVLLLLALFRLLKGEFHL